MNRRQAIKWAASISALSFFPSVGFTQDKKPSGRVIWIILRGAQDGLSTLIPHNEALLSEYRPTLWPKLKTNLIKLNKDFSIHPKLSFFKKLYDENQLVAIPGVTTGYEGRSHFEGQDFMEYGSSGIVDSSGWVGRLLNLWQKRGLAISPYRPQCMRGTTLATNWYPTNYSHSDYSIYEEVLSIYKDDPELLTNLTSALKLRKISTASKSQTEINSIYSFEELCSTCGRLMSSNNEFAFATIDLDGWDTHSNQHERLMKQMEVLDKGIANLKSSLDSKWSSTSVIISTEFGRTVLENGTGGTDHGTAGVLMLTGGIITKSEVIGSWSSIKRDSLFEQRDLQPTSNFYESIKLALKTSTGLTDEQLNSVFTNT